MGRTFDYRFQGRTYQVAERDSQRAKVYAAERAAFGERFREPLEGGDLQAATDFANRVLRSATWLRLREEHGMLRPDGTCWIRARGSFDVSDGRGTRSARGGGGSLNLPRWSRTKPVILHEIAHNLAAGARHGWPFCRAFIDLVSMFIGASEARTLERELRKAGARTRPPKQLSPERLAVLRERGRQLAAMAAARRAERKD